MDPLVFRTLVRVVAVYAAAVAAVYLFLHWYRPEATGFQVALVAVPLAAAVGYFMGARACRVEDRLVQDAIREPRLVDGQRTVAFGPVEALGPLLTSPITRTTCVAYQYLVDHLERQPDGGPRWVRDYWGMSVTPFQIRTPAGPVRVLGYARLEGAERELDGEEPYAAAEEYIRATSFRHPTDISERLGSLAEPISTEADTFADDICARRDHVGMQRREDAAGLRELRLNESLLVPGQPVCALGTWSAAKGALVPTTEGVKQLRIWTGSPENFAAENVDMAGTMTAWGIGALVIAIVSALGTRWC